MHHEIVILMIVTIVISAIALLTIVRLINSESWESTNQFRRDEKSIFLVGFSALIAVVLWILSSD